MTRPEKLAEISLAAGDKNMLIGEDLASTIEANLVEFLTTRLDTFAWEQADIIWISADMITYKLNVDPNTHRSNKKEENLVLRETKSSTTKSINF